jgi:hypothetical protein
VHVELATGKERVLAAGTTPFVALDGTRVYFSPAGTPDQLHEIALDGTRIARVATLAGKIRAGADGPDGRHVAVDVAGALHSFRIGADGKPVDEGVGLRVPAPSGGAYAIKTREALEVPTARGTKVRLACIGDELAWTDAHRVGCMVRKGDENVLTVIDVRTGTPTELDRGPDGRQILGRDDRWLVLREIRAITVHRGTNFASRPRPADPR